MSYEGTSPPQTVPDDVGLPCGDHLHWECLLDAYEVDRCPHCGQTITSTPQTATNSSSSSPPTTQLLVDLNNEGGFQRQIDIFPLLREEQYLRTYPEETKSRAFLEFCREGDYHAVAELLKSCDQTDEDPEHALAVSDKSADEILRYQDPIGEMESGLHVAVANGHREMAWMLLLLASEYPTMEFPALVFQEASVLGVMREEYQSGNVDIRRLKDAQGRTAEDIAREVGVIWNGWVGNGRLAPP